MVGVNLLPPGVQLSRKRARRIKLWTGIALVVGLASLVPLGLDAAKAARAAAIDRELHPLHGRLESVRADLRRTAAECAQLTTQIARADALRAKRSWADLLVAVSRLQPDRVWLSEISSRQDAPARPQRSSGASAAASPGEAVTLEGPGGVQIDGYALDHDLLYEYMGNLKESGIFANVELTSAGREKFLQGEAIRFVLQCDW